MLSMGVAPDSIRECLQSRIHSNIIFVPKDFSSIQVFKFFSSILQFLTRSRYHCWWWWHVRVDPQRCLRRLDVGGPYIMMTNVWRVPRRWFVHTITRELRRMANGGNNFLVLCAHMELLQRSFHLSLHTLCPKLHPREPSPFDRAVRLHWSPMYKGRLRAVFCEMTGLMFPSDMNRWYKI
jgi:hypothetical protein